MAAEEEDKMPQDDEQAAPKSPDNDRVLGVFVDDQFEGTNTTEVPLTMKGTDEVKGDQAQNDSATSTSRTASSYGRSSRSSLSSTTRRQRYGAKKSPFTVPPPFDLPCVDQFGFPCAQANLLDEGNWDERHHLNGSENELKPKGKRDYFAKYQTMKELKRDLKYNQKLSNTKSLLRSMSLPEINDRKPSFVCPDAGPPLVPTRHVYGGNMKDLDGEERMWNDRWEKGISLLNELCHPDHRAYFTQKSLFEESPSQNWRRYLDQEVDHGVWKPTACKKKGKFPPLGGRLRGRSGAPVPGASP